MNEFKLIYNGINVKLCADLQDWFRPKKEKNTNIQVATNGSLLIDDWTLYQTTGINCYIKATDRVNLENMDSKKAVFVTPYGSLNVYVKKIEPLQSDFVDYLKYNIEMII